MTSLATARPRLAAATRPIAEHPDLLGKRDDDGFAWLRDGAGIVTSGVAARVPVEDADAALAEIESTTRSAGPAPVQSLSARCPSIARRPPSSSSRAR